MHGRWRFRIVDLNFRGHYVQRGQGPFELEGADEEALAIARGIEAPRHGGIAHVQAVSVGRPAGIGWSRGRVLVFVIARYDGRGWMLEGERMHGSWHRTLEDAVTYGAFRTAGRTSETRLVNVSGEITHVILIPSDGRKMTIY